MYLLTSTLAYTNSLPRLCWMFFLLDIAFLFSICRFVCIVCLFCSQKVFQHIMNPYIIIFLEISILTRLVNWAWNQKRWIYLLSFAAQSWSSEVAKPSRLYIPSTIKTQINLMVLLFLRSQEQSYVYQVL